MSEIQSTSNIHEILDFDGRVSLSSGQQYEIFRSLGDLLFIKDSEFRILDANEAFLALYPPEKRDQVIGYTTFEDYPEHQMREFVKEDQRALDEGLSEVQETIDFPDGQRRTLLTRKVAVTSPDGNRYIFGTARDITDVIKTRESLAIANAELEEFAYRVSHDLRSPLVSSVKLLSMAEKALENGSVDEAQKFVTTSLASINGLESLAQDILSLHRLKQTETEYTSIDFDELIGESWVRHKVDECIQLETQIDCKHPPIADAFGLATVLDNLISNAIKYRNLESNDCFVKVEASTTANKIYLSVTDNGIGIPKHKTTKMFSMFQRFHPKIENGTGLGLYMVKQWVDRSNGTLKVEHLTPGTKFMLEIPQHRGQTCDTN